MLNAPLPLALEFLLHLPLALDLIADTCSHIRARLLELLTKPCEFLLGVLALGDLQGEPLRLRQGGESGLLKFKSRELRIPTTHPVLVCCDKLGLGQPCSRLLEQVALLDPVRPHVVPRAPAECKLLVHQALDAKLPEVLDTRCPLTLELLLQLTLQFGLLSSTAERRLAQSLELRADQRKLGRELLVLVRGSQELLLHRHEH